MRIALLGPLQVRTDDDALADVPGPRLRGLLAALALEAGRVVGRATLVDWIWGGQPPADATNALHRLVSRLRKALPAGSVEGHPDGYRLTAEPEAVDTVRFERLVAAGRAGHDDRERARLLGTALKLWRGAALQDVGLPDNATVRAAVARLDGLRLAALEDRYAAEIGLGHGGELVAELADLVAARRPASPRGSATCRADSSGLVAGHRLTTLIGPGGSGKTRLATETARTLLADLPDGAWLVELAAVGADGDVAQATLAALGLRGGGQWPALGVHRIRRIRHRPPILTPRRRRQRSRRPRPPGST